MVADNWYVYVCHFMYHHLTFNYSDDRREAMLKIAEKDYRYFRVGSNNYALFKYITGVCFLSYIDF